MAEKSVTVVWEWLSNQCAQAHSAVIQIQTSSTNLTLCCCNTPKPFHLYFRTSLTLSHSLWQLAAFVFAIIGMTKKRMPFFSSISTLQARVQGKVEREGEWNWMNAMLCYAMLCYANWQHFCSLQVSSGTTQTRDGNKEEERSAMAFALSPVCILDVDVHPLRCSQELWNKQRRDTAGEPRQNVATLRASE